MSQTLYRRSRAAILREETITFGCRALEKLFGLFSRHRYSLRDIPPGAPVLLVKPCCLGDVTLATATLAALSEALPEAKLDFAVGEWSRPILANNPRINTLLETGTTGSVFGLKNFPAFALKVRRRKYRAIIVLDRSPLLNLLPWLAGAKIRAGINSQGRGFALNVFARLEKQTPLQHEAAVYLEVARGLSANITGSRLEFYPSEEARLEVAAFLAHNIAPEKPLAVIHPGGGHNPDTVVLSKRWPPERFAAIAARLVEYGYNVAITGASDDRCLVDELCNHLPETARPSVISAAGRFDIDRNGALFEKARLFVGNDTGLMHLAVACGARVVAIFGPSNPLAYGPYTSKGAYVAPPGVNTGVALPLSEYQKLSAAQGGIGSITVEQVWEKVIALLES